MLEASVQGTPNVCYNLYMPFYGFKPNVKEQVVNKAKRVFGTSAKISVVGERMPKTDPKLKAVYRTVCSINGTEVAHVEHWDWRKSYKLLAEIVAGLDPNEVLRKVPVNEGTASS